jgi:SAM-dependent methyltransferase
MKTMIALQSETNTDDDALSSETTREKTTVSTSGARRWSLLAILACALGLFSFLFSDQSATLGANEEIPFVPTPIEVVDRMLELAEVKAGDVVYDLGSGDGRIVIRAAKRFGAKAVGIENDAELVALSWKKASEEGVAHLVEFRHGDALQADVSPASVVTLYMFPWFNTMMRPVFQKQLNETRCAHRLTRLRHRRLVARQG